MKYYKFLTVDNKGEFSGFDFTAWLPKDGQPGEWLPMIEGDLKLCANGYHATTTEDLAEWINAQLYEVELRGDTLYGEDKTVSREMRFIRKVDAWDDKSARLFGCWCVRQVWHRLTDERSRKAVEVAERYANGEATQDELAAAWTAARSAAEAEARATASDAAWTAARATVRDAAWVAARAAAWTVEWVASRVMRSKHLSEILMLDGDELP